MSRISARSWRLLPVALALLILVFHLFTNYQLVTAQPSPGWSRPLFLRMSESVNAIAPATLDSGESVVYYSIAGAIGYAAVTADGKVAATGVLPVGGSKFGGLSAVGGKRADLFWASGAGGTDALTHAAFDGRGQQVEAPDVIANGLLGYTARLVGTTPVVLAYGSDGLQLLRPAGSAWTPAGKPQTAAGTFKAMDAAVQPDGSITALVQLERDAGVRADLVLFRGTLQNGFGPGATVATVDLPRQNGQSAWISGIALGVDGATGYGFYTMDVSFRGEKTSTSYVAVGPVAGGGTWAVEPVKIGGQVTEDVTASQPVSPVVMPAVSPGVKVLFQANTRSRFQGGLGLVAATYRDGEMQGVELVAHGRTAFLPAPARLGDGTMTAFATPTGGDKRELYAVASTPAFISARQQVTGDDLAATGTNTFFDLVSMIFPVLHSGMWWLPMFVVVAALSFLALSWAERHPWTVFWMGVAVSVPMMLVLTVTLMADPAYLHAMPAWLAAPGVIPAIYLGVAGLMLAVVLKLKPPAKYTGAFTPLLYWALSTVLLNAMFFGPFVRRG